METIINKGILYQYLDLLINHSAYAIYDSYSFGSLSTREVDELNRKKKIEAFQKNELVDIIDKSLEQCFEEVSQVVILKDEKDSLKYLKMSFDQIDDLPYYHTISFETSVHTAIDKIDETQRPTRKSMCETPYLNSLTSIIWRTFLDFETIKIKQKIEDIYSNIDSDQANQRVKTNLKVTEISLLYKLIFEMEKKPFNSLIPADLHRFINKTYYTNKTDLDNGISVNSLNKFFSDPDEAAMAFWQQEFNSFIDKIKKIRENNNR